MSDEEREEKYRQLCAQFLDRTEAAMNQHALLDDALEALVWDNGQSFAYQNAKDELRVAARALAHVRLIAERWARR